MNSVNVNNTSPLPTLPGSGLNNQGVYSANTGAPAMPVESTQVTISEQAKALLDADPTVTASAEVAETEETSDVKAFAYGALGLEHPETVAEQPEDSSYTAGRYLKGALTIGSILLAIA